MARHAGIRLGQALDDPAISAYAANMPFWRPCQ